jgi:hypothetical protein
MRDETEQHCPDSTDAPAIKTRREALQKAIAQEKVALANLETEQADSQRRLARWPPGEFAPYRRIVLRSTPVRRSISR